MNTKYHPTVVSVWALHPVTEHTIWKKIFDVDAPIIIQTTHVPADKLMIGIKARIFPNLSPRRQMSELEQVFWRGRNVLIYFIGPKV